MPLTIPHSFHLCTAKQCREMDARTISEFGVDGFTLMELAGNKATDYILNSLSRKSHGVYICGKGNNAGDALVVARILHQYGHRATIVFVDGTNALSELTSKNLHLLEKLQNESDIEIIINNSFDASVLSYQFDFIVDGLFGTGLNSELSGIYEKAVQWVNQQNKPVFSMDIPSGLHPDTGLKMGAMIRATSTLAFGALKLGFYLEEGPETVGEVVFCDLPFPSYIRETEHYLIDSHWVNSHSESKKRKHKYDGGILHIVAGSEGLTGAAVLAARSAWATGIGAAQIITPRGLLDIYEKNLIEIIKRPVGVQGDMLFSEEHLQNVQDILAEKPGVLLIGPGLGRSKSTILFIQQLLSTYEGVVVIDADALFALAEHEDIQKPELAEWILTPHPGELAKLTDSKTAIPTSERLGMITELASSLNAIIVSKGSPTIIGTPSGNKYITGYQTDIFSRAGFGDVLAGKIAANTLLNEDCTLAICKALLDGKMKADTFILNNDQSSPAPLDII